MNLPSRKPSAKLTSRYADPRQSTEVLVQCMCAHKFKLAKVTNTPAASDMGHLQQWAQAAVDAWEPLPTSQHLHSRPSLAGRTQRPGVHPLLLQRELSSQSAAGRSPVAGIDLGPYRVGFQHSDGLHIANAPAWDTLPLGVHQIRFVRIEAT